MLRETSISLSAPELTVTTQNGDFSHPSQMEVQFDKSALRDAQRFAKSLDGGSSMVIGVFDTEKIQQYSGATA